MSHQFLAPNSPIGTVAFGQRNHLLGPFENQSLLNQRSRVILLQPKQRGPCFTYFSHLANLAEDRHHIRRRAVHERAGDTQEGSIEVALARLRWAGIAPKPIAQTLAHSYVAPVLTAHPTGQVFTT